jgi:hypothetical protein
MSPLEIGRCNYLGLGRYLSRITNKPFAGQIVFLELLGKIVLAVGEVLAGLRQRDKSRRSAARPFSQEEVARLPSAAVIGIRISHA